MTTHDALSFAETLPSPTPLDALDTCRALLYALEATTTPRQRTHALTILLANAEHFRSSDTPGHQVWYQHHLRVAAEAARRWKF